MVARREQEGAAGSLDHRGEAVERHVHIDAKFAQHVRPAGA